MEEANPVTRPGWLPPVEFAEFAVQSLASEKGEHAGLDGWSALDRRHPPVMVVDIVDRGPSFEQDVPSITREHRHRSPRNIRRQRYGSASGHRDRENPGVVQEPAPYAIGDRFPVRRKAWSLSAPNQKPLLPSQRGDHGDAPTSPARLERDQTAVGRKIRIEIVAIVGCDPDGLSTLGERLNPDIEIL